MALSFESEYQKLNPNQKKAVDTIEGPVMVIAGAGTGKTQVIALRIGKILKETQVNPSNILCLTFTDSAALNMRSRLLTIIGPDAHSVRIGTFHSFCQSVIKANPQYFLQFSADSEALDKIEQIQIIRQLIDNLPPDSPLKSPFDTYYHQSNIISAIESLKKENITPQNFSELIDQVKDFLTNTTPFYQKLKSITAFPKNQDLIADIIHQITHLSTLNLTYRTKIASLLKDLTTGKDMKSTFISFYDDLNSQYPKQLSLSEIYPKYQQELVARHRFDFDDMILSVISAFKNNPDFLSTYQEKFQYILVDEYQDTNSSQNEIIHLLCNHSDNPNLFVVGDDDQSIFRFQGANIENIFDFHRRFGVKPLILHHNYRSHRLILDLSDSLITRNLGRISHQISDIDKKLIATRDFDPDPVNLYSAPSLLMENYQVASQIKRLIASGISPNKIAVLFRNNADISDLLPFFSALKISYVKDYGTDITSDVDIQNLITFFNLLVNPDDQILFSKVINFSFLKFRALDLYKHLHSPKTSTIFDKRLSRFQKRLQIFQKRKLNYTADYLFNFAIRRFGYLKYILKIGNIEKLKFLERLYTEFKKQPSFDQAIARLQVFVDNSLPLVCPPLLTEVPNCIHLSTVHKAKGQEFEHVFIIKALASRWESPRNFGKIYLPLGVFKSQVLSGDLDTELEENRRLFYVALTRAQNQIYLSYTTTQEGREQPPTRFLSEINQNLIEKVNPPPQAEQSALLGLFSPREIKLTSVDLKNYLTHYFATTYRLNITHINSYQKCPLCFFFKSILRLPQSKNKSLSFGTSVHGSLAYLFNLLNRDQKLISLKKFLSIYKDNLKREKLSPRDFSELLLRGQRVLTAYYQNYSSDFVGNSLIEHDFRPYLARLGDIPITGKIDKIEIISGKSVNVVDFKTGSPDNKSKELKPDGNYFRQLLFYKILSDNSPGFGYNVVSGTIDFVEPKSNGKFAKFNFSLKPEDITTMEQLIWDTYQSITSLKFSPSPDCSDPDHLHSLSSKWFK